MGKSRKDQIAEVLAFPERPLTQPRIILGDIEEELNKEFGTHLLYIEDETTPIALVRFEGEYTYSTLIYATNIGRDGLQLPENHVRCVISPIVIYTNAADSTPIIEIVDEGGTYTDDLTVQAKVCNIPNFENIVGNRPELISGIIRMIANTPHCMINGAPRARFTVIRKMIIDRDGCEYIADHKPTLMFDNPETETKQGACPSDQDAEGYQQWREDQEHSRV